jgi:hypothetical protein
MGYYGASSTAGSGSATYLTRCCASFDGEPYDGSIVNVGARNADESVHIIGIREDIQGKIRKKPGDTIRVTTRGRD